MVSFLERLKHVIHEHPVLYPALQCLRGHDWGEFCDEDTDLCIEGYQSSSNSFVYNVFRLLAPDLSIAHHTHSVSNLKLALRHDIPTLIVFRNPVDSIPSLASRFKPDVEQGVYRYQRFYRFVLDHVDAFVLASFEETTSQIGQTIRRVESNTSLDFGTYDSENLEDDAIRHIREWTASHGDDGNISLPKKEREQNKEALRSELATIAEFHTADRVYDELQDAFRRQKPAEDT